MSKAPRNFRFRSFLTIVVLALLVTSMLLIGLVSLVFAKASVDDLATTVMQQAAQRVSARLEQFFDQATDEAAIGEQLLSSRPLTARDFPRLARAILPSFQRHRDLNRVYFALQATNGPGEYFMLERQAGDCWFRESVRTRGANREDRIYLPATNGWRLVTAQPADDYDPHVRPFFRLARDTGRGGWTEAYEFWSRRAGRAITGVTYAAPISGADGQFAGALGVDLETTGLNAFLRALDAEMPGYPFILEQKQDGMRQMVAHPWASPVDATGTRLLPPEDPQFQDPAVFALLQHLPATLANLGRQNTEPFEFTVAGSRCWGVCARPPGDTRWLVGIAVPRAELMIRVREYAIYYLMIFCGVLTAAVLAIFTISRRASHPLLQLYREAEAVGRLEFGPSPAGETRIFEIGRLAGAMARMKSNLRSFQKYVPADVVGDLVRSGHEAVLGGEKITASIYFSDIADFTAISEKMEPEALVAHLGEYLGAMSDGIARAGGTVDKFIGDAVMAFWNAPRADAEHALHACAAALANQRRLDALAAAWRTRQLPPLPTRIGLHTGPVVVGNIGSEVRMNYTIIGDSVNLASRLEALNKFYGTRILLSRATLEAAGDAVLARPLDCVNVKGKSSGVTVHELLALRAEATPAQLEAARLTTEAFALYRKRKFSAAAEIYARLTGAGAADHAADVLLRRCRAFAAQPPGDDWDTTFRLDVK